MSETTAHPTHLREKKTLGPRTIRHTTGHGDDAFDSDHGQNGLHGSCPFPSCPQPARWRRLDTRRRLPESIEVCFDHQAADLALLPPLREGNAGPVAASMLMLVDEHPDGITLRDAGRRLRILPTEVARLAKELGLPVLHGKVHRAVAGPSPKEARAAAARMHEQMKPPVIEQLPKREHKPRPPKPKASALVRPPPTPTPPRDGARRGPGIAQEAVGPAEVPHGLTNPSPPAPLAGGSSTPAPKADAPRVERRDRPGAHVGIDADGLTHRPGGDAPANGSLAETEPPTTTSAAEPAGPEVAVVVGDAVVGASSVVAGDDLAALVTERDPELAEVTERDPEPEPPQTVTEESPVSTEPSPRHPHGRRGPHPELSQAKRRLLTVIVDAGDMGIAPGVATDRASVSTFLAQTLVADRPDLVRAEGATNKRLLFATEAARAALAVPPKQRAVDATPSGPAAGRNLAAEGAEYRARAFEVLDREWVSAGEIRARMGEPKAGRHGDSRLPRLLQPLIDSGQVEARGKTAHRRYRRGVQQPPPIDFDVPKRAVAAPVSPQRPEPPPPPPAAQERQEVAEGPGALGERGPSTDTGGEASREQGLVVAGSSPGVPARVTPVSVAGPRSGERYSVRVLRDALDDTNRTIDELLTRRQEIVDDIVALGGAA